MTAIEMLNKYLEGRIKTAFMKKVGLSRSKLYGILGGRRSPNLVEAARIQHETGIPVAKWADAAAARADSWEGGKK